MINGDREVIQRYKLPASRKQHPASPGALFHVSNTGRYLWLLGPERTKTNTGGVQVPGVVPELSDQTNVAGVRRALVMVKLKTSMSTTWIRG